MPLATNTWRPAFRSLFATPLVTTMAILSLALGIGANTALFSIFNSVILRTLPVHDPGSLAVLTAGSWTYPIWEAVKRRETDVFNGAFAWSGERFDLSQGGEASFIEGAYVSGRIFEVLGISAARGRLLTPADDATGADAAVAVISHRYWQQRYGGTGDVVGQRLTLQRVPFTVVGVMPSGFFGPDVGRSADVMIPFAAEPLIRGRESFLNGRSTWWLDIMVRMKPGQTLDQANTALRGVQAQIRSETLPPWPAAMLESYIRDPFTLAPAATGRSDFRRRIETPLLAMIAAVGLVLLIACANIANLLLARALTRRREFSVRLALGASRWQIARILLAESLMIAGAGAALGLVFAQWSGALLVQQFATWRGTVFLDLTLDWRVLGFTALLTVVTAIVAGVATALGVNGVTPNEVLKDAGRSIMGGRRIGLRGTLVVAQIALSLILVVAAGLFLRTFSSLSRVPLGFTPESLVVVSLNLQPSAVGATERVALTERLRVAATAVPGVTSAGVSLITPISGSGWNNGVGEGEGVPDRSMMTWQNAVTPGWFSTMGMRLIGGRDFTAGDRIGATLVAVVNETFAKRFLPGQQPVGQTIRLRGPKDGTTYEIVGYVADAVYRSPREGMVPTLYVPLAQREQLNPGPALVVAAAPGQRAAIERALSSALKQVDPAIAFTFRTFDDFIGATVMQERLVALLSTFFGGLALLLAGIGLYGLMSHAVGRRRTEIGVRMALGADPAEIVRLVVGRVGVLLGLGIAIGVGISLWASKFLTTLLFQLDPRDPVTFTAGVAVLVVVGVVAAWLPARRAALLDPASVLREG
jgi:predicted permease